MLIFIYKYEVILEFNLIVNLNRYDIIYNKLRKKNIFYV